MFDFYTRLNASQNAAGTLFASLAALTKLSRAQIRVFAADATWNEWGI